MNKTIDNIIKLGVIAVLIIAVTTRQQYNYYTFLRWTVFITSLYFAYKYRHVGIVATIIFCAFSILFNPFIPFGFRKGIWNIIDLIVSAFILMSIDWKDYKDKLSPKGKLIYNLIKPCFWCFVALLALFWIYLFPCGVDTFQEYQLITKSTITTKGLVTDVGEESSYEGDSPNEISYSYCFSFSFMTDDGRKINSSACVDDEIPDEYKDLSHPYPIDIVYLKENPEINMPKDQISDSLGNLLRKRTTFIGIILLVISLSVSFSIIKNAIKKYLAEIENLTAKI